MELTEDKSGWRLTFASGTLQMLKIDFRLGLLLADGIDRVEVVIETPLRLVGPAVNVFCNPETPESLAPILDLINKRILGIEIDSTGHMNVSFKSGLAITVEADPRYEAWQVSGSTGFLLVCQPEGRVAIFRSDVSAAATRAVN